MHVTECKPEQNQTARHAQKPREKVFHKSSRVTISK